MPRKPPAKTPAASDPPFAAKHWPATAVEMRPLKSLIPSARNARLHSAEQVEQIAASIERFGWTIPVLTDEGGEIIAGHGRVLAAQRLGIEDAPVMVARGWSADEKAAYRIADNQHALNSTWDNALLKTEMLGLKSAGFDFGMIGFDPSQALKLLGPTGAVDPEHAPEPPADPVSRAGDRWLLGAHALLCGDATSSKAVGLLLAGADPRLMVTDPPYGVKYDPTWRDGADLGVGKRSKGKVLNDDRADWSAAWALFPGDVAYVWHGGLHSAVVQASLASEGFDVRAQIIWAKQHFVMSRGDYHWMHEPCWYAVRRGKRAGWAGDRRQTTVWTIANNNSFGNPHKEETWGHGTQKPTECMRRPIENNSRPGDSIYEPFCGAGTTIIAAEMTGRRCFAMELDPAYVDVCVQRWQVFTGKAATLEDGRTFEQVSADRKKERADASRRSRKSVRRKPDAAVAEPPLRPEGDEGQPSAG